MSTETLTFHEKVVAVQKAAHELSLTPEGEGQVGGNRNYKYLTIGKLHAAVLPLLFDQGLSWVCAPEPEGLSYCLSDGTEATSGICPLVGCGDMQKLGSAITYARRYCLLSVLGLTPDEDDDGAAATSQSKSEAPEPVRQAVPQIPGDRAKKILDSAVAAGLAEGTELKPALVAKLNEVGVETGKLGHLNVDQAETIENFIAKEAA